VDTLEVFEEAVRKAGEEEPAATTDYNARSHSASTEPETPLADPLSSDAPSTGAKRGPGGGRGTRTRPTKTQDLDKAQRQLKHIQRTEHVAAARSAEDAARGAARLAPIPEHTLVTISTITTPPLPSTPPSHQLPIPPTLSSLQPINPATINPIDPSSANIIGIQDEECFTTQRLTTRWSSPPTLSSTAPRNSRPTNQRTKPTLKDLERTTSPILL
jgi:hypothetical protein